LFFFGLGGNPQSQAQHGNHGTHGNTPRQATVEGILRRAMLLINMKHATLAFIAINV